MLETAIIGQRFKNISLTTTQEKNKYLMQEWIELLFPFFFFFFHLATFGFVRCEMEKEKVTRMISTNQESCLWLSPSSALHSEADTCAWATASMRPFNSCSGQASNMLCNANL